MTNFIICKKIIFLVALTAVGLTFDGCRSGGLHEKHAEVTWNLGARVKPRKLVSTWLVAPSLLANRMVGHNH
jgi:hypothetical protein